MAPLSPPAGPVAKWMGRWSAEAVKKEFGGENSKSRNASLLLSLAWPLPRICLAFPNPRGFFGDLFFSGGLFPSALFFGHDLLDRAGATVTASGCGGGGSLFGPLAFSRVEFSPFDVSAGLELF